MAYDVFISASKEDKATADAACALLEREGMRCWIAPRDIPPGQSYSEGILSGINQARLMVLVFSSHANGSNHVQREVERAVNRGIPIIPFRIENVPPQRGLEYFLSLPNWLDAFDPPLEQHLSRLAHASQNLLTALSSGADQAAAPQVAMRIPMAGAASPNVVPPRPRPFFADRRIVAGFLAAIVVALAAYGWFLFKPQAAPDKDPEVASTTSSELVLDFDKIDTSSAPGFMVAADPYLHAAPIAISIEALDPETSRVVLVNNMGLYGGRAVAPTRNQNFLTQTNTGNVPASFTLTFAKPVERVSFLVPKVYPATESGITFPAWRAVALSASGQELGTKSQALVRRFADVPAETTELSAPAFEGISAVRFESDPRLNGTPFAAFSAILIEEIKITPREP
jgi:hypothetical protein